jgi:hypothetical protein
MFRVVYSTARDVTPQPILRASVLIAVVIIWASMIPAVASDGDEWWTLIFAGLATLVIFSGGWRSLGLSRLVALAGIWASTGMATASNGGTTAVFAFLATAVVVHGWMRQDAILNGLGIATAWFTSGLAVWASDGGGEWTSVFAFLTAAVVANHRSERRGGAAILWWGIAAAIIVASDGDYFWLTPIAFVLTAMALGFRGFTMPRRVEWDL